MFESAKLSTDSDKAQFWNSQRLKVKNFELRLTYLERLYFTELLAVQGVASCIALSMPWRSSEGAGSGQLSRLFSTQLIMASTFLQYQVSISNQNRETLEFSFCLLPAIFLLEDIKVHLVWISPSIIRWEHLRDGSFDTSHQFILVSWHTLYSLLRYKYWNIFNIKYFTWFAIYSVSANISYAFKYLIQIENLLQHCCYILNFDHFYWIDFYPNHPRRLFKSTETLDKSTHMLFCHHLYGKHIEWHCPPWTRLHWDPICFPLANTGQTLTGSLQDIL